jgi:methanogenic corrinoid protein MtbC1
MTQTDGEAVVVTVGGDVHNFDKTMVCRLLTDAGLEAAVPAVVDPGR